MILSAAFADKAQSSHHKTTPKTTLSPKDMTLKLTPHK